MDDLEKAIAQSDRTAAAMINALAAHWDAQGKPDKPISVRASRSYLMRTFKPKERGGELYCGEHPLILVGSPAAQVLALDRQLEQEREANRLNTAEHDQRHLVTTGHEHVEQGDETWLQRLWSRVMG